MDTRVVTESDVNWIVEIFLKSGDLVLNRERLCLTLGLTISQLEDINIVVGRNRSQTHGFLTLGLTKWVNTYHIATFGNLIKVLRILECNSVADQISEELPKHQGIPSNQLGRTFEPSTVWFNVPEKVFMFTGRRDEMENLHKSIMGQNAEVDERNEITVISTVSGLGGIGKTTLAIHYAWKYFSNKFYFNVVWVNAETIDTIEKSLYELADEIELTKGSNTLVKLASKIYKHFEPTSTLFVFDNVEEHEHVKPYLPIKSPKASKQYVLITSRNKVWNRKTDLITLNVFPEEDSVEFLRSYLKLKTDSEIEFSKKIARELQNLPLAIRQAGAYIDNVCLDDFLVADQVMKIYLDLFQTNSRRVLCFECDSYEKTVYSTWKITLDKIKSQNCLAVRIMQIISYFNSDNIPIQLLHNIPEEPDSQNDVNINKTSVLEAVKLLSKFSMITRDSQFNISVHRLVQKVIRDDVELTAGDKILEEAMSIVITALKTTRDDDYEENCILHASSLYIHMSTKDCRPAHIELQNIVTSKQKKSTNVNIQCLSALLKESKYDEAEESFYETRDEYLNRPNGGGKVLSELFTVRFIKSICKEIINLNANDKRDDILRLSELCNKLLQGFRISTGGWIYSLDFQECADSLNSARDNTYTTLDIQRSLIGIAAQMYKILFDCSNNGGDGSPNPFRNFHVLMDCFSYLKMWTEMLKTVETLYAISIDWYKSKKDFLFNDVFVSRDHIFEFTRRLVHGTSLEVRNKALQLTLNMYNDHYSLFLKDEEYDLTLQCLRGRIDYLQHLNRPKGILEVIGDLKLVVDLLNGAYSYDYDDRLFKVTKSIIEYSNHTNCTDIKTDLIESAVVNLELIFNSCMSCDEYNVLFINTVVAMLNCLAQLNRLSQIIKIGEELKSFVDSISIVELNDEFPDINDAVSKIENEPNCTTDAFNSNLTEFSLQIYKFTFNYGIRLEDENLIQGSTKGALKCLAELDKRQEIIFLADCLKTFLVTIETDGYHEDLIEILELMFEMSKHPSCQDIRIRLSKTLLQCYQLTCRQFTSNILVVNYSLTRGATGIMNCLAELGDKQTLLETFSNISGNISKFGLLRHASNIVNFFQSLFYIPNHPNCTAFKTDLLEIALTNYRHFYDRCKESGKHSYISKCINGMLTYLMELNQTPLFIQYVSEEFQPFLLNVRGLNRSKYYNVIAMIDKILKPDLIKC